MRYALGRKENGEAYALRDPREMEIAKLIGGANEAAVIVERLHGLPGLFPAELVSSDQWRGAVTGRLKTMLGKGMRAAIGEEAALTGP
jgi:fructuronate reductase